MPSPVFNIAFLSQVIQYTGSNSADIAIQVPNVSIVSESNGVLTLDFNGSNMVVHTTDWVMWDVNGTSVLPNSLYLSERDCVPICSELEAVAGDLAALAAIPAVRSIAVAPVPPLGASASTTVSVTLDPAMSGSGYSAVAMLFAGADITPLQINSVTVMDADTVDVVVQNTGPDPLSGSNIMVVASE